LAPAASALLYAGSAVVCLAWTALVLSAGRGPTARLLAAACAIAGIWAAAVALTPNAPLSGIAGALEILRLAVWFALLLSLYRRIAGPRAALIIRRFALAGGLVVALGLLALLPGPAGLLALPTLGSPALITRLGMALLVVLLAENLYRNADETSRWHVNLPCIALGGLAGFDLLLYADAALSRDFSPALLNARAALTAFGAPLLAIAAVRDGRWRHDPPVSRQAVFHGATLVVAGAFLLGVGALGESLRLLGTDWGPTVQASLLAGAVMALAVAIASRSVRSRLRGLLVDHFFSARYDYRREWLRCVAVLSAPDEGAPAERRAIRATADPVDSPAGLLLLRDFGAPTLHWAGSWNLPAAPFSLAAGHSLLAALGDGEQVLDFDAARPAPADLTASFGPLWLAVPLSHPREGLAGVILLAPPRATFALDREVFDLLRTIGREIAMFLAERLAAERLAEQRPLQDYAKRFAFVAHDVKTVASQLSLLLANAEDNLQDPEFQTDMLLTVRASANRINTLIARLTQPGEVMPDAPQPGPQPRPQPSLLATGPEAIPPQTPGARPIDAITPAIAPLARLRAIVAAQTHPVLIHEDAAPAGLAAMAAEPFDVAFGHLLNNAAEASRPGEPVEIRLKREAGRILVDIIDHGPGMTPEFIRDALFRPLSTSKAGGSGIGAWQARELLTEAGGELTVLSRPGVGTTMRLVLPAATPPPPPNWAAQSRIGRA
jgi:putative PEP-CTERM system histidine kinase